MKLDLSMSYENDIYNSKCILAVYKYMVNMFWKSTVPKTTIHELSFHWLTYGGDENYGLKIVLPDGSDVKVQTCQSSSNLAYETGSNEVSDFFGVTFIRANRQGNGSSEPQMWWHIRSNMDWNRIPLEPVQTYSEEEYFQDSMIDGIQPRLKALRYIIESYDTDMALMGYTQDLLHVYKFLVKSKEIEEVK